MKFNPQRKEKLLKIFNFHDANQYKYKNKKDKHISSELS